MIIAKAYARKLIREGKADYSSVVDDGEPKESSIRYLERTSLILDKSGEEYVAIVRHDKQRIDHYRRKR